jgi:AcrR family transcriptional regulator
MDRIAEGARVGKGTIYRYYESKEKLFEAVADDAMNQLRDFVFSMVEKSEGESPVDRLTLSGKAFLEFFDEKQALLEVFLRGGSQFRERLELKYLEMYEANSHIIRNLLDECVGRGFAKASMDTRALADIIGDMLVGLVYMWGVRRDKEPLSRKWPMVEAIILKGVLA